jgi:hypothetical protein
VAQVSPQVPTWQACPAAQVVPHLPQLSPSDWRSTQVGWPPTVQMLLVPSHDEAHAPAWQACPEPQVFPQLPQLAGSVWVSLQALPQTICPVGQAQAPAWQVWPVPQAFPQAPQLAGSVWVIAHAEAQAVPPTEAQDWQVPVPPSAAPRHTSVPVQSLWVEHWAAVVW